MNRPTIYFVDINDPDETGTYESNYRHTVLAADYDALLARAKTAEADFLAAAECNVEQRKTIQRFQTELATERLRADAAVGDANAAERRVAELEGLLRECMPAVQHARASRNGADYDSLADRIDAELVSQPQQGEQLKHILADVQIDRAYIDGMKAGWNFAQADDENGYARAVNGRLAEIRDTKAEQAAAADEPEWPKEQCPTTGAIRDVDPADLKRAALAPAAVAEVIWPPSDIRHGAFKMLYPSSELMAGVKLYTAAALAPAAVVVMPERMTTIPEGKTISYAAGYEDALNKVARLNRNTVSLELLEQAIRCLDEKLNKHETHATKYATADQLRAILGAKP